MILLHRLLSKRQVKVPEHLEWDLKVSEPQDEAEEASFHHDANVMSLGKDPVWRELWR